MDVSSSVIGNMSMVDIASEDIEGATTLALNNTKSNDLNSAYTRRTPQNLKQVPADNHIPELKLAGLSHWYQNQQQYGDVFNAKKTKKSTKEKKNFYKPSDQSQFTIQL